MQRWLIMGASRVILKPHVPRQAQPGPWRGRLLSRKPSRLVRVALATSERQGVTGPSPPRTAPILNMGIASVRVALSM